MPNGLSVKQAIENELEGKDEYTINDTVKCVKHIADGLDNLQCSTIATKVDKLETRVKFHAKIFGTVYAVTIGLVIAYLKSKFGGK